MNQCCYFCYDPKAGHKDGEHCGCICHRFFSDNNLTIVKTIFTETEPIDCIEAAKARFLPLKQLIKAILLKDEQNKFYLASIPANKRLDLKKIAKIMQSTRLSFATPEEVKQKTGCNIGAVFPYIKDIKTPLLYDLSIREQTEMNVSAGDKRISYNIKTKELITAFDPIITELTQQEIIIEAIK